jgi:hypothetical protein
MMKIFKSDLISVRDKITCWATNKVHDQLEEQFCEQVRDQVCDQIENHNLLIMNFVIWFHIMDNLRNTINENINK